MREKQTMKRPQMNGWTVCGILKNRFILETNTQCSAQKWGGGRFAAFLKNRFIIQLYWEMKFIRKSQSCITLREKILCPRKNWIWTKIFFQKLSTLDLGGWTVCGISQKWCEFWKYCLLQGEKWFFRIYYFRNIR